MEEKPKRTRTRKPKPEVVKPLVEPIHDGIDMQTGEPKPKMGRPPKEEKIPEAIIKLKEAMVIVQTQSRLGSIDRSRAHRVSRDLETLIRLLQKTQR